MSQHSLNFEKQKPKMKTTIFEKGEEKLETSIFFVEANSFEQFMLWKENRGGNLWEDDSMGFTIVVGHIDDNSEMPVNVCFNFATINNHRICFYYVTSRFSDMTMVENYIIENYPVRYDNGTRRAMTDAQNFHHALGETRDRNKK